LEPVVSAPAGSTRPSDAPIAEAPIVDAHHHIWRLDRTPWLQGPPAPRIFGEHSGIRRDYLIDEYAAQTRPHGVSASVYVQVNVAPGDEVEEVEWASTTGARQDLVQAVISFADLEDPAVADVLDAQAERAPLRGVRQQLHWHENPAYRYAAAPDVMLRPGWQRGLREVMRRGLVFELQVFPGQYGDALHMIDAFPDVTFVLLHAGMPQDRSDSGRLQWRRGLAQFAQRDNLYVKLSGLGTFTRSCELRNWRPIITETLDAFGPHRCLFGSNFPIESLWTSYEHLLSVVVTSLGDLHPTERAQVLGGVARRLYAIS
jgi:predicted TIM-barrel fold metal-dependent hydrolase